VQSHVAAGAAAASAWSQVSMQSADMQQLQPSLTNPTYQTTSY
jgi:hypothetical protein